MNHILLNGLLFFCVSNLLLAQERPQKIRFSFGSHNAMPYALTTGNDITSGIIWDIGNELADELGLTAEFVNIPRKRQEQFLIEGKTDVILVSNPAWFDNQSQITWSNALFKEQDVLVTLSSVAIPITTKRDLYGLNLGTIRGYKYPAISQELATGQITFSEVRDLDANFERLLLKRVDVFVDSGILIYYRLATRQDADKFVVEPYVLSEHFVYAAISKQSSISAALIIETLDKLVENGAIEAILHKYQLK